MTDKELKKLLSDLQEELQSLLGEKLVKVILYGSYANKTFDEESDVDIMVLTDLSDKEIEKAYEQVDKLSFKLSLEYGVVVSILVKAAKRFYDFSDILPFYTNVLKQGITIYE